MNNEMIHESWWNYLKSMSESRIGDMPYLFRDPHCGTCSHWHLIDEDALHNIAVTSSPKEYDEIFEGMSGKRLCVHREKGNVQDTYRDYRFYGWCKRFPPMHRGGYSVIGFRSFFTLLSRRVPNKISEYDFPLMPHDNTCGEWQEDKWVKNFLDELNGKNQVSTGSDSR